MNKKLERIKNKNMESSSELSNFKTIFTIDEDHQLFNDLINRDGQMAIITGCRATVVKTTDVDLPIDDNGEAWLQGTYRIMIGNREITLIE